MEHDENYLVRELLQDAAIAANDEANDVPDSIEDDEIDIDEINKLITNK